MRNIKFAALAIASVIFAGLPANSLRAEVRVQGQPGNVRIEARDATVAEILAALKANNWNRQLTAEKLDINRTTLYKKMKKFGLQVDGGQHARHRLEP